MVENKLEINLPSDSKAVNYRYVRDGGYFNVKILIKSGSISTLKEQLDDFFGGPYIGNISETPNFENTCEWWDLDKENIDIFYSDSFSEEFNFFISSPKSRDVWAFITKEYNGECYLYIAY
jgi:hypothetical protein